MGQLYLDGLSLLLAKYWHWLWIDGRGCSTTPPASGLPRYPQHVTIPGQRWPEIHLYIIELLCAKGHPIWRRIGRAMGGSGQSSSVFETGPADSRAFGPVIWKPALRGAGRAYSLKACGLSNSLWAGLYIWNMKIRGETPYGILLPPTIVTSSRRTNEKITAIISIQ